jgi:predicted nucleic acid-binding protein
MILVDSSVLIDVIERKMGWFELCANALHKAKQSDELAINPMIYAEVSRSYETVARMDEFLRSTSIAWLDLPKQAAFDAARAHDIYRERGGQRDATLPDFFIGAHAKASGLKLLTRDPKRIRNYFPEVNLIIPQ